MFPSYAEFYAAPFHDEALYMDALNKIDFFWNNTDFYGVNISGMRELAIEEKMKQPIIEHYDPSSHLATPEMQIVDFRNIKAEDLINLKFSYKFRTHRVGVMHGVSFWFNCLFCGCNKKVMLSTGPDVYPTHWYQVRLLMKEHIGVNPNQRISVEVMLNSNKQQSYDISLTATLEEANVMI